MIGRHTGPHSKADQVRRPDRDPLLQGMLAAVDAGMSDAVRLAFDHDLAHYFAQHGWVIDEEDLETADWIFALGYAARMVDDRAAMQDLRRELDAIGDPPPGIVDWVRTHPSLFTEPGA